MQKYKVGVFDSGMGGLSVANAIEKVLPDVKVVYAHDSEHVPYGSKPSDEVFGYVMPILSQLIDDGCQVLVIACNTVTTTLIDRLRAELSVPLIGVEPMIKSAAHQTKTGVIAVCATPGTLQSARYAWLKETYAKDMKVIEPDCSNWSYMIESEQVDHEQIRRQVDEMCKQKADVIVLGCTHYHWIEDDIKAAATGRALVVQPEQSVIRQLVRVLEDL